MIVRFWKMSGAGNDFVLLDRLPRARSAPALARRLCDRRLAVGADGLLVVSRDAVGARVGYWNADGSSAFCGNGTRCAALWAHERKIVRGDSFAMRTIRGVLSARLTGPSRAEVAMPQPARPGSPLRLRAAGRAWVVHPVDSGTAHAVVFVDDAESVDAETLGRSLRRHPALGPGGANVDFVQARERGLVLRTYERGVEAETLACGTGVMAAAAVARALGLSGDRVSVRARGGLLRARLAPRAALEGPGKVVFTGEIDA